MLLGRALLLVLKNTLAEKQAWHWSGKVSLEQLGWLHLLALFQSQDQ